MVSLGKQPTRAVVSHAPVVTDRQRLHLDGCPSERPDVFLPPRATGGYRWGVSEDLRVRVSPECQKLRKRLAERGAYTGAPIGPANGQVSGYRQASVGGAV